jgi:hypothetical protein
VTFTSRSRWGQKRGHPTTICWSTLAGTGRVACRLFAYRNATSARRFFSNRCDSLHWQRLKPFQSFARLIERHWNGIAAYCDASNKVSLGFVEGLNN